MVARSRTALIVRPDASARCTIRDVDRDFTEDELQTFEGWARYQTFDLTKASAEELAALRRVFDDVMRERASRRRHDMWVYPDR